MKTTNFTHIKAFAARCVAAFMLALSFSTAAWAADEDFYFSDGSYHITSADGWLHFCNSLNDASLNGFSGQTVCLDADISVSTMAGSNSDNSFRGTFDGQNHTLTVSFGTSSSPLNEENAAPFRYTGGYVIIKNLHVSGEIYTNAKYAAGFIAQGEDGNIFIRNCVSSVAINSGVNGDGTHAGFVAISNVSSSAHFEGCLFNGKLLGTGTNSCGGFIGWRVNGSVCFRSCIFAPTEVTVSSSGSHTFCRNLPALIPTTEAPSRTYYTRTLGDASCSNGHFYQMCSISQGSSASISFSGNSTSYDLSGITVYGSTEYGNGLKYGSTYYGGLGERIKINISYSIGWGYMIDRLYADNGTVLGEKNPFIVCPENDGVVVNAHIVTSPSYDGKGTEDNPCIISDVEDLNNLRTMVNNGTTFEHAYFRQDADITFGNGYNEPIGTKDHPFMGHYDGNGKKIKSLTVNSGTPNTGCFGHIQGRYDSDEDACNYAVVHDLTIEQCTVLTGQKTNYGGMVVGYCDKCAQIKNCTVNNCTIMNSDSRYGAIGILGGLVGRVEDELKNTQISGNRVINTSVSSGQVCSGLIGETFHRMSIYDNFATELNVHAANDNGKYQQAALIGKISNASAIYDVGGSTYHDNYYRSNDLTAVYGEADGAGVSRVYLVNGIPEGTQVSGKVAVSYNGTNYYSQGATVTFTLPLTSDKSFLSVSGANACTISDDKLSATITFGTADVNVALKSISGTCGDNATWTLARDLLGNYSRLTISGSGAIKDYEYTTDGSTSMWRTTAPWGWEITSLTIGDDITSIGNFAFIGCQQLSELNIGTGVTTIGSSVFDHCDGLTTVNLPANVTTLSAAAFKNCVNLQRVNLMKSDGIVTITGANVFDGCPDRLIIVAPTPALAVQYQTAAYWSSYAAKMRVVFGSQLFTATDEGGTPAYDIATVTDLQNLATAVNEGSSTGGQVFRQTADITLSGTFTPIGNSNAFTDTYDGGGHVISGLIIMANDTYNALFGLVSGGTIKNVVLMNPTFPNTGDYTAALIGRLEQQGTAVNCYAYGTYDIIASTDNATVDNVTCARKVTLKDNLVASPDASDIANGFVYNGETYYREGIELNVGIPGYTTTLSYTLGASTLPLDLTGNTMVVPDNDITFYMTNCTVKEWEGTGTADDPYVIEWPTQLDLLAKRVNLGNDYADTYFRIAADIAYDHGDDDTESNYTAIAGYHDGHYRYFKGHFDGDDHVISGIRIYMGGKTFADQYQGLFGRIDQEATVSRVILADTRITGYNNNGAIAGDNYGSITDCQVLSTVTVRSINNNINLGGIAGYSKGTIAGCSSAAAITIADNRSFNNGGIVGYNDGGTVADCLYLGTTVSGTDAGAIVGNNQGSTATVQNSYYTCATVLGGSAAESAPAAPAPATAAAPVLGAFSAESSPASPAASSPAAAPVLGVSSAETNCAIGVNNGGTVGEEVGLAPQDDKDNTQMLALLATRDSILDVAAGRFTADEALALGLTEAVTFALHGRTFQKNGKWQTICLPFDVAVANSPLDGATVKTLTSASLNDGTLTLTFSPSLATIEAGKPYIIRWADADGTAIANPAFRAHGVLGGFPAGTSAATTDEVTFMGSYSAVSVLGASSATDDAATLFLGTDNNLYFPHLAEAAARRIGAFRAFFKLRSIIASGTIHSFVLNFGDDDENAIVEIPVDAQTNRMHDDGWYGIDGRKYATKPNGRGIFINNGRKYVK